MPAAAVLCTPSYIHALPVDKDACRALQQGSLRHSAHGLRLSKGCGNAVMAHDCTIRDRSRHLEHVALEGATYEVLIKGPGEALARTRTVGL